MRMFPKSSCPVLCFHHREQVDYICSAPSPSAELTGGREQNSRRKETHGIDEVSIEPVAELLDA